MRSDAIKLKIKLDSVNLTGDFSLYLFDDKRKQDVEQLFKILEKIATRFEGKKVASDSSSLLIYLRALREHYQRGAGISIPQGLTVHEINARKDAIANALIDEAAGQSAIIKLPAHFLFGTATSALQIETAGYHDWTGLHAKDGSVLHNTIAHEKFWRSDADIISYLGNAYRCSLDWGRLQRAPYAEFDAGAVAEYRGFLSRLKMSGLYVMLTLHHYASPIWFTQNYTWAHPESVALFKNYTEQMIKHFGDLCDSWVTFNEPELLVIFSYVQGKYPPYKKNLLQAKQALDNIVKSHNEAYSLLKKSLSAPVGIAKNEMYYMGSNFLGSFAARTWSYIMNSRIHSAFSNTDYVGINYYGKVTFNPFPLVEIDNPGILEKHGKRHDDMWEYAPILFIRRLKKLWRKYHKPIHITENGCCTKNDNLRIRYVRAHLYAIQKAIQAGVDVRSYFYWSTFDNFELALGPSYRFGLVEINPITKARTIKPSGHYYAKLRLNRTE